MSLKAYTKLYTLLTCLFILLTIKSSVLGISIKKSIPSAPQKITVVKVSSSEIDLKWHTVSGAIGYKIFRGSPNNSKYVQVGKTSGTVFKNMKLKSETSYWYYIKAYNKYGTSKASIRLKSVTNKIPSKTTNKIVLGFATNYYNGDIFSYNSMVTNTSLISQITTVTYLADSSGNLSGTAPLDQITYANNNKIKAMAMVSNNFDGKIAKAILESPVNSTNLINTILLSIKTNAYKGVNIDLEGIYPSDRNYFSSFIKELYNKLHPQGFAVTVSIPAKTVDNPNNTWSGAFDYAQISKYADSVVLMTYDEHSPSSEPGPIASIGWVKAVVNYTTSVIPKNKILLGVSAYGYDWSSIGTKAYGIKGINNLISKYGAKVIFDKATMCPYFKYSDKNGIVHTVWFENSTSLISKLDIVNTQNLSGIAMWRLGLEDPSFWTTIKTKFNR